MSLTLFQTSKYFLIKSQGFVDQGDRTLVLERNNVHVFEVTDPKAEQEIYSEKSKITEGPIFGIVGIMNIVGMNYLCVIKEAQVLGKLYGSHVYKITDIKLLPFQNIASYIEDLKKYLCEGFYFSYGYDLTCSRQRRIKFLQEKCRDPLRIIAADHRYFWNINLYKDFIDQKIDVRWFTPLIQGYIGIVHGKLNGREMEMALITRRSIMKAGTRYNARGIDDNGNVANFAETEQMVRLKNIVFSYVIIRGSVPVFWEQKGVLEGVTLSRGPELTKLAFHKHFEDLFNTYGPQLQIVDLLSDTKQREIILTKEYVRQVYESEFRDRLKFLHFDFHHYCSGDRYQSLKVLIGKLGEGLQDFGFFVEDVEGRKVQKMQKGVFRVNCLDSLDRTNVAQSKIGLMVLQRMLQKLGFIIEEEFSKHVAREGIAFADVDQVMIHQMKHFWAEQGDYISMQYAGTNSTISKVARDNKEGFVGKIQHKMKNVKRYFINTLSENVQQNSIDIILGRHAQSVISSELGHYLKKEMKAREDLFTEINSVKLYVGTWNLAGVKPYDTVDIKEWLFPFKNNFVPEILVIGFQEIVELTTSQFLMGNNQDSVNRWKDQIITNLNSLGGTEEYVYVTGESLMGLHIGLFTHRSISQKLADLATSKIKLGFSGKIGNKGAVLIRFLYEDTSFCFINCHLESGVNLYDQKKRAQQITEIFQNAFIKERGTQQINYTVANHKVKVLFGDLNYRIFNDNQTVRQLIEIHDYDELKKFDELALARQDNQILRSFKEGPLAFDPTYKYNYHSDEYDTSSKARIPAWCDRILYDCGGNNLLQLFYGRAELKISDHRPVLSLFEAKIRKINEKARQEIEDKLIQKFKSINAKKLTPQVSMESSQIQQDLGDVIKVKSSNSNDSSNKSKVSLSASLVEPSIGDFGLAEPQDSYRSPPHGKKPPVNPDLTIKDPKELEIIIKENGVHFDDDQMKFHQEQIYPQLLERQVTEHDESQDNIDLNNLERESQLAQLFFKREQDKKESGASVIKKIGIFNDSDSEGEEKEQCFKQEKEEKKESVLSPKKQDFKPQPQKKMPLFSESDEEQDDGVSARDKL